MGEVRYNDHSERHQRAFLYKKKFQFRKGRCPIALTIEAFPFVFPL
jgi:hypothetical protein